MPKSEAQINSVLLAISRSERYLQSQDQTSDVKRALRALSNLRNDVRHGKVSLTKARLHAADLAMEPGLARDNFAF